MRSEVGDREWIRFDAIEIDVEGHRLRVDGTDVPLERKAFAVLVLLARHPGRVFTRDEILDAVWGHTHVTPGVLNRIITLLRQALGESAGSHRYLHTVHGVGYRLDRPLEAGAGAEAASPVFEAVATAPQPAAAPEAHQPRALYWLIPLLVVVAAAGWLLHGETSGWLSRSKASANPAATAPTPSPTLVVLPLHALGDNHDEAALTQGLSEDLTTRLSRIEGLGMISATSAAIAQSRQFDPAQLAEHLKATHALEGSLRETGEELRINLRLVQLPGGKLVWTQAYDRPITGFLSLQDDVAKDIARVMSLRDVAKPHAPEMPVDAVALRRFLDLRRQIRTASIADWEPRLRALATEYPDYAQPHGLLGAMLAQNAQWLHTDTERAEAEREASLALKLDPDDTDARIALAWIAIRNGDWERATAMYDDALRLAPTDTLYRSDYGMLLGSLGYLDGGLHQVEIGIAYDPLGSCAALNSQVFLLDALGRRDEAKRRIDIVLPTAPTEQARHWLAYGHWYNAYWRHDAAEARTALEAMPDTLWKASYVAVTDALEDPQQWPRARAAMDESEQRAHDRGNPEALNFLRLLDPQLAPADRLALTARLSRSELAFSILTIWAPEHRALRQSPAFQSFLRDDGRLAYWNKHGLPPQCQSDGDTVSCK